jgi:DNA-binding GntR family transcriptional regulator
MKSLLMLPTLNSRPKTTNSFVYDSIRQAIFDGHLLPGTRLTKQMLSEWLEVSRTPIREALQRLQTEGLVQLTAYRGAMIALPSAEDIREEYTLRAALEGLAVELAVQQINDSDIVELRKSTDRIEELLDRKDIEAFLEVNHEFHIRLYGLCGSRRLVEMIDSCWHKLNVYRRFYFAQSGTIEVEKAFHGELLEACCSRSAERARKIVQQSCFEAAKVMVAALERSQETAHNGGGASSLT